MQSEMAETAGQVFSQLNNSDMRFGIVKNEKGQRIELSHAALQSLLDSSDRDVRANAFNTYYKQYAAHAHTFAASLNGSIQRDIYNAKVRNFQSALEAAMFPDVVPTSVYDNLLTTVHRRLPALYHYYDVRRRKMNMKDIHFYDTYVPILSAKRTSHTWDQAVKVILSALQPLGSDYCGVIQQGLEDRWCDRYENRGKRSGAFSAGSFDGKPYILINYQPDVLDSVFTLIHEGGHSMHSYYSAKTQPYAYFQYVIFVAEVASTFNETLLSKYLLKQARDDQERAFLLNREIDSIRLTRLSPNDVRRVRETHPRLGRVGRAADIGPHQGNLSRAAATLFRSQFHAGPGLGSRMSPRTALLQRLLRLQVRHRHVGGHRVGQSRAGRRREGTHRLSRLPQGRLLERPARLASRGGRRHGAAAAGRYAPWPILKTWSRNWTR